VCNIEAVKTLIEHKANPNIEDNKGITPLHHVCFENFNGSLVELLISAGAHRYINNPNGMNPLRYAYEHQKGDVVDLLIKANFRPDVVDSTGSTPLHCVKYQEIYGKLLSSKDIDIDAKDKSGKTPLQIACEEGNKLVIKILIENGAETFYSESDRHPILCYPNDIEMFRYFNECGADLSSYLFGPAKKGNIDFIDFLIKLGFDKKSGGHALLDALEHGHTEVAQMLIKAGVDPDIRGLADLRMTPLHFACRNCDIELTNVLISKGVRIDVRNGKGWTALCEAASSGCSNDLIGLLLKEGADPNVRTSFDRTPIHWAVSSFGAKNRADIVEALINAGADINAKDMDEKTAVFHTSDKSTIKKMIELGANLDIQDDEGNTPLHVACREHDENKVKLLLDAGANPNIPNNYEKNQIDVVDDLIEEGNQKITEMLIGAGAKSNKNRNVCKSEIEDKITHEDGENNLTDMLESAVRYRNEAIDLLTNIKRASDLISAAKEAAQKLSKAPQTERMTQNLLDISKSAVEMTDELAEEAASEIVAALQDSISVLQKLKKNL
jgi:ankyrin repeat protein